MRAKPRCFVVLPDHVYPDVEVVVDDFETYVVVEKTANAGEMATLLDPRSVAGDQEG